MGFTGKSRQLILSLLILMFGAAAVVSAEPTVTLERGDLGTIKGVVRDESGSPIPDATVAIFRHGTAKLLKQVNSTSSGYFLTRIMPGTYTVLAVAQGFNPVTLFGVEVTRAAELSYGFKLERAGDGNTLPEKRVDRNSSKWRIRAAQSQRAIYQNQEGKDPIGDDAAPEAETDETGSGRKGQTVVETYFAGTQVGSFAGVNFATLQPVGNGSEVLVAGQTGVGRNAPMRLETAFKFKPGQNHQFRLHVAGAKLGNVVTDSSEKMLAQASFQALDEWKVRDDLILVVGFDYARFLGAGNDFSWAPRLGLQFDINSKTRFRTAFTTQTEEKTWARAIELEGESVAFAEPIAVEDFVVQDGKPQMNKSRRLEFGVERLLSDRSSLEANAFFDTTIGRGVGFNSFIFEDGAFDDLTAEQQGSARGLRVVYTRRLNSRFSTTAGYSFGNGQKIAGTAITDPASVFENDFFQSFFGQLTADLKTGTSVRTIYRLSPEATVFAIDPFKGRLAIYDPGLSVYVTQRLPNWGFPFQAQAIVDARNILDHQTGISGEEGILRLNSHQRTFRGAIQVRF